MTSWTNTLDWHNRREIQDFISKHSDDDVNSLAFTLSKRPLEERNFILNQIQGRQKATSKFPFLANIDDIIFPPVISIEQSSSEATAIHKSENRRGKKCIDLTAGLGIDSHFLSKQFEEIHLLEQNEELLEITKHNFNTLGVTNAFFHNISAESFIENLNEFVDLIFIDPSRRNMNKKVFLIEDSSPNLLEFLPVLRKKSKEVLVKLSPMLDIRQLIKTLPDLSEIEVLSLDGECKEILVLFNENNYDNTIKCTELGKRKSAYTFSLVKESDLIGELSDMGNFAYLPNAAVTKAGAFKSLTNDFGTKAISLNTHIYTSKELIQDFPGKKYECLATINYNRDSLFQVSEERKFNIVKRNFRDNVSQISKKLGIGISGELYLFCYNDSAKKPCLSICRLIDV